jgi:hypothetical protein
MSENHHEPRADSVVSEVLLPEYMLKLPQVLPYGDFIFTDSLWNKRDIF